LHVRSTKYARKLRIPQKIESEMNLLKFWIRNVTRILPSKNYLILYEIAGTNRTKCPCKNALLPVKLPWSFASFVTY